MNVLASIILLTNLAYSSAYDDETLCPAWVSYDLDPYEVVVTNRAAIKFAPDPRVNVCATDEDYLGSGYDRGHMAPAADFNFDRQSLEETYLFTNVCPQDQQLNRGEWAKFEREIRNLAASGTVHVVAFPIFFDGLPTNRIGRVAVPHAFEKVAFGWFGVRRKFFFNFRSGMASVR